MDTEAIGNCVGLLSKEYLTKLPHHVVPCTNLHAKHTCSGWEDHFTKLVNKSFPYSLSLPVPLTPLSQSSRSILNGLDPTTILIREKMKWQSKRDNILTAVRKDMKSIREKQIRKALKVSHNDQVDIPQGVALLAQHLDKDPDPNFSGAYNWYYTGGTLATLSRDENYYLLHGTCSQLGYSKYVEGKLQNTSTVDLESDDPIFQITTNTNGAAVRQKYTVSVFSAVDSSDMELQLTKVHAISEKSHSFLSVALPKYSIENYSTISNNYVMKLWDTNNGRYTSKHELEPDPRKKVTDSWSYLQYLDKNTLLCVNRSCIHIFDVRSGFKERQFWFPGNLTEMCEQLSCVVQSNLKDQVIYSATTHQALAVDIRFGFYQRWTHTMVAPPLMGFAQALDQDREMIFLGSQVMSDCVVLVNEWEDEEPKSMYKPTILPPPARGLHQARQQGCCLDPTLTQRCTLSMTGLSYLPAYDGLHIVRQSATGDIFIQKLSTSKRDTSQLTDNELEAFSQWSKPTLSLQRESTTLTVSGVADFTQVFKVLTNTKIPVKRTVRDGEKSVARWQVSKKYLEDCVDLLAGKMLAVWDVEDEDEWLEEDEGSEIMTEQDPEEKVLNWLDASKPRENKNITLGTPTKPAVTSTPFPLHNTHKMSPCHSPEHSWTVELMQHTPGGKRTHSISSPGSSEKRRKRPKLCYDSNLATPVKQPMRSTKQLSSAKTKFIPGF